MTVDEDATVTRRADENPGAAQFGANPETHKLDSYPLLDWLRFVLASVVALGHEGARLPGPIDAALAVDVFLALSGWLIGGILIATSARGLPRFFFNRVTRIWIPFAFAILLIYGLAAIRDGVDANWFKYLFYDVTFTHYNFTVFPNANLPLGGTGNHFWSLSIEEQFYLLAPAAMLLLPFGKKLWLWLAVGAVMTALQMRAAPIAFGVAAAVAQRDYVAWQMSRLARWLLPLATAILFVGMCIHDVMPLRALFAIGTVLSLAVVGPRGRAGMLFGAISYPLYLNHWMGDFALHAIEHKLGTLPSALGIALAYACAVTVGFLSWAMIDRWVMAHRASWYRPALGRALGITAYAMVAIGIVGGLLIRANGG